MEDLIMVLKDFGVTSLWGVVLYKLIDSIEMLSIFILIGWGIKKGWKPFITACKEM